MSSIHYTSPDGTQFRTAEDLQDRRLPKIAGPCGLVIFGHQATCPARS